jgi:transcriptional regulator with XRE-family HTH domain
MRLSAYLKKHDLSPEKFAEIVGLHMTTVYRLLAGDSMPKRSTIGAIVRATNGEVRAVDLLEVAEEGAIVERKAG